jgi:hypothetical protein
MSEVAKLNVITKIQTVKSHRKQIQGKGVYLDSKENESTFC